MERLDGVRTVSAVTIGLAWVAVTGAGSGSVLALPVLVVGLDGLGDSELVRVVAWLAGGAVVGGAIGYAIGVGLAPEMTVITLGFGIAIGGGLGTATRLLAGADETDQSDETMTVGMETDEEPVNLSPQPADLFELHPDPLLYYEDTGTGPVVRAANDAFESVFGVSSTALEGAAIADGLMTVERTEDIVSAAGAGEAFDGVLACETGATSKQYRIRVVAVDSDQATRGYVLYSSGATGQSG